MRQPLSSHHRPPPRSFNTHNLVVPQRRAHHARPPLLLVPGAPPRRRVGPGRPPLEVARPLFEAAVAAVLRAKVEAGRVGEGGGRRWKQEANDRMIGSIEPPPTSLARVPVGCRMEPRPPFPPCRIPLLQITTPPSLSHAHSPKATIVRLGRALFAALFRVGGDGFLDGVAAQVDLAVERACDLA